MVLSCQAGIGQISFDVRPVAQAVVVEYFQIVGNDEGYIVIPKAFTKHNQPSYTPVSVLEGVDGFEALMKVQNIFKCRLLFAIVFFQQSFHLSMNVFRHGCIVAAHFIGEFFVVSDSKPIFSFVRCSGFQNKVELFDVSFGKFAVALLDDVVYGTKMVGSFDNVVYIDSFIRHSDRVGFKDIACLVVCQPAAFDMIGVIC